VEDYAAAARVAVDLLADYVAGARAGLEPVTARPDPDALGRRLDVEEWIRRGGMDESSFADWLRRYLDATARVHHPGSIVHQVAVPSTGAALADLIHGVTNNPTGKYEMGAAGATLERELVRWLLAKVGFDREAGGGVLTHGGSLANLTALLAARAHVAPEAWRAGIPADLALLAPPSVHYSIRRAAAILGLGEDAVIELEVDRLERIRPERLIAALARCGASGRRPLALVAVAGATSTGLYDDLRAISAFCGEQGIWLHVDAAHGGGALLSERHRHLLDGIECADSVVWDAHKLLRTSALCAAVLVRRGADLSVAFRQRAAYLTDDREAVGFDLLDRSIESTKPALGLKLFLSLAWLGERRLGAYIASRYELTRRFHDKLAAEPRLSCPYVPESNILCFRVGGADEVELRERLLASGRLHISATTVAGERYLRIVVTSPDTDERTLDELVYGLRSPRAKPYGRPGNAAESALPQHETAEAVNPDVAYAGGLTSAPRCGHSQENR
jgi:L-2,4-diaminobutyrate decarboxylase